MVIITYFLLPPALLERMNRPPEERFQRYTQLQSDTHSQGNFYDFGSSENGVLSERKRFRMYRTIHCLSIERYHKNALRLIQCEKPSIAS